MADKGIDEISLDNLAKEKLSQKILELIENVEDIDVLRKLDSGITLKLTKKNLEFWLILKTPTKKIMKWFGGLTAVTGGAITVLKWLLPIVLEYFKNSYP